MLGILVSGVCIAPVAYAYFGPAGQLKLRTIWDICEGKYLGYFKFDVLPPLRPLHLAAVHEAGAGEAEGGVQEENDHRNITR